MILNIAKGSRPNIYDGNWHNIFLLWPTRINDNQVAWLQTMSCRHVVIDEGTWAGGSRWEFKNVDGSIYQGPIKGD